MAISFGTSSFGGSFPKKSGQGKIPQFLTIQTMLNNYKETDNAFQRSPIIQESRRTFNKFANMIIHPRPSLIHFASLPYRTIQNFHFFIEIPCNNVHRI